MINSLYSTICFESFCVQSTILYWIWERCGCSICCSWISNGVSFRCWASEVASGVRMNSLILFSSFLFQNNDFLTGLVNQTIPKSFYCIPPYGSRPAQPLCFSGKIEKTRAPFTISHFTTLFSVHWFHLNQPSTSPIVPSLSLPVSQQQSEFVALGTSHTT